MASLCMVCIEDETKGLYQILNEEVLLDRLGSCTCFSNHDHILPKPTRFTVGLQSCQGQICADNKSVVSTWIHPMMGKNGVTVKVRGEEPNPYHGIASHDRKRRRRDDMGNQIPILQLHPIMGNDGVMAQRQHRKSNSSKSLSWYFIP